MGGVVGTRYPAIATSPQTTIGFLVVVAGLSAGTVMRNLDYVTPETLALKDFQRQPRNPRTLYRIGCEGEEDPAKLATMLRRCVGLSKSRGYFYAGTSFSYRRDLGDTLLTLGRIDEAEVAYQEALLENNGPLQESQTLFPLAVIASMKYRPGEAEGLFQRAMSLETSILPQIEEAYQFHQSRMEQSQSTEPQRVSNG